MGAFLSREKPWPRSTLTKFPTSCLRARQNFAVERREQKPPQPQPQTLTADHPRLKHAARSMYEPPSWFLIPRAGDISPLAQKLRLVLT